MSYLLDLGEGGEGFRVKNYVEFKVLESKFRVVSPIMPSWDKELVS